MKTLNIFLFVFIISIITSCKKDKFNYDDERTSFMVITQKVDNISTNSATLHGCVVAPNRVKISYHGFMLREQTVSAGSDFSMGPLNFPGNFDFTAQSLSSGKTYVFYAYAFDEHDFSRSDTIKGVQMIFTTP